MKNINFSQLMEIYRKVAENEIEPIEQEEAVDFAEISSFCSKPIAPSDTKSLADQISLWKPY